MRALVFAGVVVGLLGAAAAGAAGGGEVAYRCKVAWNVAVYFQPVAKHYDRTLPGQPHTVPAGVTLEANSDRYLSVTKNRVRAIRGCGRTTQTLPAAPQRLAGAARFSELVTCQLKVGRVLVEVRPVSGRGKIVTVRMLNGRYLAVAYLWVRKPRVLWSQRYCNGGSY